MNRKTIILWMEIIIVVSISYLVLMLSCNTFLEVMKNSIVYFKIQVINYLFLILLFWAVLAIFRSFWISSAIFTSLNIVIAAFNYGKVKYRKEGILPTDLSMLKSLDNILTMINPLFIMFTFLLIILTFVIIYISMRKTKLHFSWYARIATIALMLFSVYGIVNFHQINSPFYKIGSIVGNDPKYYNPLFGVSTNGPIINFANNVGTKIMDKPKGYSKRNVFSIINKYKQMSIEINKKRINKNSKQKVVFILSESFSDPLRVPDVKLNYDPIPFTRELIRTGVGGTMISSGYGGGTANMEYQALTGLTMGNFTPTLATPYTQLVVSEPRTYAVNNLFCSSQVIHPYTGIMYKRTEVFNKMKFNKFDYLKNGYPKKYSGKLGNNPYVSDMNAYRFLLKQLSSNNKSQFIQLSTMQNHLPFNKDYYDSNVFKAHGKFSDEEKEEIENYSQGINYTDNANRYLIDHLKKIKQNVTVVFYGDHLPAVYSHVNMARNVVKMHETPYFIWSNHLNLKKDNQNRIVGTYSFADRMMSATNTKISPYYALVQNVTTKLPIISAKISNSGYDSSYVGGGMNLIDSKTCKIVKLSSLSPGQKKILKEYKIIQYDLTSGKGYSENSDFMTKIH